MIVRQHARTNPLSPFTASDVFWDRAEYRKGRHHGRPRLECSQSQAPPEVHSHPSQTFSDSIAFQLRFWKTGTSAHAYLSQQAADTSKFKSFRTSGVPTYTPDHADIQE
eukprot:3144660-Pyramimonas_sp.AAC.1